MENQALIFAKLQVLTPMGTNGTDNRFVLKEVSPIELEAFLESAPLYFEYLSNAIFHQVPTILGKIYGVYTVKFKNSSGKQWSKDLIVMENLFYSCPNITQVHNIILFASQRV